MPILTELALWLAFYWRYGRPHQGLCVQVGFVTRYNTLLPGRERDVFFFDPSWVVRYEAGTLMRRQEFVMLYGYPPVIPGPLLDVIERHEGQLVFYSIDHKAGEVQWVSPVYRTPHARWQRTLIQSAVEVLNSRSRIRRVILTWFWRSVGALVLAVGGPLAALWIARQLGWSGS